MTARRLQHASVQVPPELLERTSAFYRDVLLLRPVPHLAGVAWFETEDGDQIHLLEGPGGHDTRAHFALHVDDLEGALGRARASGAEPELGSRAWGADRWFLRDPAGNMIEIFEVPPPASPR